MYSLFQNLTTSEEILPMKKFFQWRSEEILSSAKKFSEEILPDVKHKLPFVQPKTVSVPPVIACLGEGTLTLLQPPSM